MYIHLGRDYVLNDRDIIGIFNLETTTIIPRGREFLNYAQKNGAVVSLSDELPQCYVLADGGLVDTVYLSELSPAAMRRRAEKMIE
ncbi:MAG: extracellular matrix regulator RemB [Faecalibacterium prausnitzii]